MSRKLLVFTLLIPTIIFGQPENLTSLKSGHIYDFLLDQSEIIFVASNGIFRQQLNSPEKTLLISLPKIIEQPCRIVKYEGKLYYTNKGALFTVENIRNGEIRKLHTTDAPITNFLVIDPKTIAYGTMSGEFSILDIVENKKRNTVQFPGLITCILADAEEEKLIISDIKGNLKSIGIDGKLIWTEKTGKPIFDLHLNKKFLFVGSASTLRQLDRRDFSFHEKYRTSSWATHISGNTEFITFGTVSGEIQVLAPFTSLSYSFNSSIVKVSPVPTNNSQIELVVLSKSGELVKLSGMDMKMKGL